MSHRNHPGLLSALTFALFAIYLLVVLRDAWVGDDIFITLRTVKQWVMRGELVWNPHERVQAYTHPLWMMCLAAGYALTHEPYYTTLAISLFCSIAAIFVVLRRAQTPYAGLLFLALLINSRAFIDYSTSGLENPLTHLLCALTFALFVRPEMGVAATQRWPRHGARLFTFSLLTALAMCNRLDTVLLVAPMSAYCLVRALGGGLGVWRAGGIVLLGASPILAWELFSLIYYGSLVPNTALAKLNTQIPSGELAIQGLNYYYESLTSDHLTLITILTGLFLPVATGRARHFAIIAGPFLYCLYIIKIGGDFMSGRFFTSPLFLAAALATQLRALNSTQASVAAGLATLLNLSSPRSTIPMGPPQSPPGRIDHRGIADERGFYMGGAGLAGMNRHNDAPHRGSRYDGESLDPKKIHVRGALGYVGFHAALDTYIVDHWALTDPLVARMPAIYHPQWRIGHFSRALPGGYIESLQHKEDRFHMRKVAAFYKHLQRIITGPLWTKERWLSIWKLQTGQLDNLIPKPYFRYHGAVGTDAKDIEKLPRSGTSPREFGTSGIFIDFHKTMHDRIIALDLDADDDYRLLYEKNGQIIGQLELSRIVPRPTSPQVRLVEVAEDIVQRGYQALRIVPVTGHKPYRIWHIHTASDHEAEKVKAKAIETRDKAATLEASKGT